MLVSIRCQALLNYMLCKYSVDDAEALNVSQVHSVLISRKIFIVFFFKSFLFSLSVRVCFALLLVFFQEPEPEPVPSEQPSGSKCALACVCVCVCVCVFIPGGGIMFKSLTLGAEN